MTRLKASAEKLNAAILDLCSGFCGPIQRDDMKMTELTDVLMVLITSGIVYHLRIQDDQSVNISFFVDKYVNISKCNSGKERTNDQLELLTGGPLILKNSILENKEQCKKFISESALLTIKRLIVFDVLYQWYMKNPMEIEQTESNIITVTLKRYRTISRMVSYVVPSFKKPIVYRITIEEGSVNFASVEVDGKKPSTFKHRGDLKAFLESNLYDRWCRSEFDDFLPKKSSSALLNAAHDLDARLGAYLSPI